MTIIHFYPNFDSIGGAQSMVLTIYKGMKSQSREVKISGFTMYENIHDRYKNNIPKKDYIQFKYFNIKPFKNNVLVSHHRKITTYLVLLSKILFFKFKIVHVAHNEFFNLKHFTFYPKFIIAVSNGVKENLITEFNVNSSRIKVIYNGIINDFVIKSTQKRDESIIKLLYPARINMVKKQLDLVKYIKENDIKNICISFCGDGDLLSKLRAEVNEDSRFIVKGLVNNMQEEFINTDFTLLFTDKEGLPVSLIESCKFGKPIICNDVGGNLEIVDNKFNGFVVNSYQELAQTLLIIKNLSTEEYLKLCANSKQQFIDKFTEDKMVKQYLKIIDAITYQ